MIISTIKYRKKVFKHPDFIKTMGIRTYETLKLLHNEIKSNAMAVHSNIWGVKHSYLVLVVRPTAYALLTNIPFIIQLHPGNFLITIAATLHDQ